MSIQYYEPPNGCVYCGSGNLPPNYDRMGTSLECMKKGFGGGMHSERRKWQQRLGMPVEPEMKALCGDEKDVQQKLKNYSSKLNNNSSSSSSSSSPVPYASSSSSSPAPYSSSSKNEIPDQPRYKRNISLPDLDALPPPISFDYPVFSIPSSSSGSSNKPKKIRSRSRTVKRITSSRERSQGKSPQGLLRKNSSYDEAKEKIFIKGRSARFRRTPKSRALKKKK
jgi:CCR4-NOT transcriptional regulation complex NOT5 subunit